ncbi:hypothetical protein ELQ35_04170 [Peribacillus cavernae]|uniref:Uncharacterized protein n=1 Tax=Peribacillus cavernae TaxID=1674310 RepID=A0A433HT90_9BACI|nr:YwdI family protein [Peribacillus cavernae]MDQ0218561.1 hypothetical protein [Peribacillus cavernae]RUQ31551.1 hypothetical protein ELQ35_04170 [Peribacillus cavernae]
MDISSKNVIDKMGELVNKAKHTESPEKLSGYVTAIQTLCDLLLEEKAGAEIYPAGVCSAIQQPSANSQPVQQHTMVNPQPVITSMPQSKPVKIDDANGDSLFDF